MVEILGKLGIDVTTFFQFGIFFALAIALKKLLFVPLQQVIQEREDKTTGLEGKAEEIINEANKLKDETESEMTSARQGLYLDLKESRDKVEKSLEEKFQNVELDAEKNYEQNLKDLKDELSLLDDQLAKNTDELSGLLTTKLTK